RYGHGERKSKAEGKGKGKDRAREHHRRLLFAQVRNSPPFTWMVWPVMKVPSGPTSRRTMAAISSTVPKRFRGIGRLTRLGGAGPADVARAVSMAPGEMALQVILCGASSTASARTRPSRPAFDADTWQRLGVPTWVEMP